MFDTLKKLLDDFLNPNPVQVYNPEYKVVAKEHPDFPHKTYGPIYKFVRNKKNHPIGVVVAIGRDPVSGLVDVGWSKLNRLDKWDKNKALKIAIGRAKTGTNEKLPYGFEEVYDEMVDRGERYYKKV